MPRSWYVSIELHIEVTTWEEMAVCFAHTFYFVDANVEVNNALLIFQDVVLKVVLVAYPMDPHVHCHIQSMMECCNISGKPEDDDEFFNINIPDTEGSWDVTASDVPMNPMTQTLNIKKVNIGMEENSKFANIGD